MKMNQQKIQHRLGNYEVVGLLSYGSTSNVLKIRQIDQNNQHANQTQTQNNFELISINMACHHDHTADKDEKMTFQNKVLLTKTQKDWILKLYNLERMIDKENALLEQVKYDILVEIIFLTYLEHPGIVRAKQMLIEYQKVTDPSNPSQVNKKLIKAGIVMEICEKGCFNSLQNYINRTRTLKQNKISIMKFYLTQVANTLMYLNQQCKILHRDLKAENIMINKQLDIKVIDYGVSKINIDYLSKIFQHPQKQAIFELFGFEKNITVKELYAKIRDHQSKRKNLIGSKHYISPELVEKYRSDMQMVDEAYEKTDIWSFGVFMYRTFHQKYPFEGRNLRETLDLIVDEDKEAQISQDLPEQVAEVIRNCLKKDYTQRASWKDLMKLKYFSSMPINDIFNIASPIIELIARNKKETQSILSNADRIFFDEKLILKYENEGNKKRRVLVIKEKNSDSPKLLVLKEQESISWQISLSDPNFIKIQKQEKYIQIQYQHPTCFETIKICNEMCKELTEKLVESILQIFEPNEEKKIQKERKTGLWD